MQESFLAFRKHYVKNIAEAIDDLKDIQFRLKQYWNNLPTAEKEHFSQSSPTVRVNETFCFCKSGKHKKSKIGPLLACDICDNWYHSSSVKIDEDHLKCMPVFTCPKCFKEIFLTFSSYTFKKYIENWELNLANVQKEFCKENKALLQSIRSPKLCINFKETSLEEFTRGIKCYSSRGINNNYNNCYANASFLAILGSSVFDLLLLKCEQETDIKTRLLNPT